MLVKSTGAEMGDNAGQLNASIQSDETQIAFNGRYLRDALKVIVIQRVSLLISGPSSPGIIKPVGEAESYVHVIMPMHVAR